MQIVIDRDRLIEQAKTLETVVVSSRRLGISLDEAATRTVEEAASDLPKATSAGALCFYLIIAARRLS